MSEIADLRRCDIEVDGRRVHLRLTGKTGTRRFPLPEPIAEAMRVRARSEDTSAFPSFGLARACKRAGVRAFAPHGCGAWSSTGCYARTWTRRRRRA